MFTSTHFSSNMYLTNTFFFFQIFIVYFIFSIKKKHCLDSINVPECIRCIYILYYCQIRFPPRSTVSDTDTAPCIPVQSVCVYACVVPTVEQGHLEVDHVFILFFFAVSFLSFYTPHCERLRVN